MATLNTLRTRGALFLSIIIGLSLIAFLLGDLAGANSVFQNRKNRVGSIAGNSIGYVEFTKAADNLENIVQAMSGRSSLGAEETDQVREMVWEQYIRRYSYEPGYRSLGITVGEAEQIDMVKGVYTSPVLASMFPDPATGQIDRAGMADFIKRMEVDNSGRMSAMWDYAKSESVSERTTTKFMNLVRGAMFVNNLEVARGVASANNSYNGRYAMLPFSGIADSLVDVSSSDIKAFFNKHKETFRQGGSREIEYVTFDVAPSEADYAAAAEQVAKIADEFAVATDAMQFASTNTQERTDPRYYTAGQLSGEQLDITFGTRRGQMAGPTLTGNVYTISRLAGERMLPDSVGARHILLPFERKASADSLVRAIRGGADIFALAPLYSIDRSVDLGRFPPEMMVEPFAEAVIAARSGDVLTVDTQFGTHVVQVTYKAAPVRKVQLATIIYNVEPSSATEQAAYNKARDFLTAAAGSRENFDAAVTSTSANRRVATIGDRDRNVSGLENSRELVRWSFNTKPGTVSTIFEIDGNYLVAVLTGAKEAGIAEIKDVAQSIASRLRNDKKAAMLSTQMAGKSIDEIATMTGAKTGDVSALKVSAFYDPSLGVEPAVMGAFTNLTAGQTSKPVEGYSGVYVVSAASVDAVAEPEAATDESERVRLEADSETSLLQRIMQVMVAGSDIKDNRARFF
jgi:peptidyl-prolyl cis-trans isomerase D